MTTDGPLDELAAELAPLGPPVIVFCKSHSGSRLLARMLGAAGVFLGAQRSETEDALALLPLVRFVVEEHHPHFGPLFTRPGDDRLAPLVRRAFRDHVAGMPPGRRWGWKLPETAFALPVFARLFPRAWFVHLLRDGRDVAFSDQHGPVDAFHRKLYFDTDELSSWRGMDLDWASYGRQSHVWNAQHWVAAVRTGRAFGSMLGERYTEVRYEDLCFAPAPTMARLCGWLGLEDGPALAAAVGLDVRAGSVGKHRRQDPLALREALDVLGPTLLAFGYASEDEVRAPRLSDRLPGTWARAARKVLQSHAVRRVRAAARQIAG